MKRQARENRASGNFALRSTSFTAGPVVRIKASIAPICSGFEDEMAVTCAVCQGTAEIAYQMTRADGQDAGKIQAAVDAKWAPKG